MGDADAESRLAVFPALPHGGKYELVLSGAEYEAFRDLILPARQKQRNPNHHRVILAVVRLSWIRPQRPCAPWRGLSAAWVSAAGRSPVSPSNQRS